jgi:hypothetical protein
VPKSCKTRNFIEKIYGIFWNYVVTTDAGYKRLRIVLDAKIFVCFTRGQPSFLSSYSSHFLPTELLLYVITHNMAHLVGLPWTSDQRVVQVSNYTRHKKYEIKNIHASRGIFFFLFVLSFVLLLSVNSIHCVTLHPHATCFSTTHNTNIHAPPGFFCSLYFNCTSLS